MRGSRKRTMEFRRLDPTRDEPRLRAFLRRTDSDDYLLEELEEWVHDGRLWEGDDAGEWVAFGRLHDLGEGEGWLSGFRVIPERRGQGIGGQLLAALVEDARGIGVTGLRAAIEDGNLASRRLFERFGFRSVATMALRRGFARSGPGTALHRATSKERLDGPVDWLPALIQRVDLLPGSDGGRFGSWRPSLVARWASEGKLYVGPGLAVAVQTDWWPRPRTLWVNPLRGHPTELVSALDRLARALGHEEWQAFLPSTDELRAEYSALGLLPHPAWGDRIHLYEWIDPDFLGHR